MKVHSWNFFFLLGLFFCFCISFCLPKSLSKRVFFFLFFFFLFVSFLIISSIFLLTKLISGTQNEIYFVIKRVREHSDLKWQLDFVKKEKHTKQEENKMEK